ncbi:MAG: hypothetical protein KME46_33380, partial [Brasilonema angustatum HA4187-MV1]|nr:hypothetical protein [Brasilonema angustatum HA4187-MV1]
TQFSSPKKQRIAAKYAPQLKELVRAYLHSSPERGSDERVKNLISDFELDDIKISDVDVLLGLAQDFVSCYELLGYAQTPPIEPTQSKTLHALEG